MEDLEMNDIVSVSATVGSSRGNMLTISEWKMNAFMQLELQGTDIIPQIPLPNNKDINSGDLEKCMSELSSIRSNDREKHCVPTVTKIIRSEHPNHNVNCSGRKIFEANYTNTKQIEEHFKPEIRVRVGAVDEEFVVFGKRENSYIDQNGILHLVATWSNYSSIVDLGKSCTALRNNRRNRECTILHQPRSSVPALDSALLQGKDHFIFKYGRVKIRAKMPIGDWLAPILWLVPKSTEPAQTSPDHIKIAFTRGNTLLQDRASNFIDGRVLFGGVEIARPVHPYNPQVQFSTDEHFGKDFHDFEIIWREDKIIYKFDGIRFGHIESTEVLKTFEDGAYLMVGLTAGGKRNFNEDVVHPEHKKHIYNNSDAHANEIFKSNKNKFVHTWKHPELEIAYIHVYSTDNQDE
ncbi:gram-negative bacteria-binding protein 2-like [Scaptodrosophila lebanonensis]|uniref:Gram-negative bacteria-binding protein 2-like n=1 Tax=Drosophila lebanonensis TaxID=7225 RepID=A0A6J2TX14_DROLE|nr:gram-negative bacteria-binding protein 2-like [Scaptodrosophila lebanonensis]